MILYQFKYGLRTLQQSQVQWYVPKVPATWVAVAEDLLSSRVQGQSGQHCENLSLKKKPN